MAYEPTQARRIAEGKCKDCGVARGVDGTTIYCRPCASRVSRMAADRRAQRRREWAAAGALVCNTCGAEMPSAKHKTCDKCRLGARGYYHEGGKVRKKRPAVRDYVSVKARQAAKRGSGVCILCSRPVTHTSNYCRRHWLYNSLRRYGFKTEADRDAMWAKLEAQGFHCYYTDVELVPGVNCSLDHRIPRSRGGDPLDPSNCVWADRLINAFKNDLTEPEFVERCRSVVTKRG